jgi:hypothetical protein
MLWVAVWSVALVVSASGVAVAISGVRFARSVAREAHALCSTVVPAIDKAPLATLPPPVQRYLVAAGADRHAPAPGVRILHGGTLTTKLGGAPLPIRGEQYFRADPPGFIWWGRVRMAPGLWIDARDKVVAGEGRMTVKAASILTIADVEGPHLDQGALVRLLGEMTWFPTSLLDRRYVSWTGVDDTSARATLRVSGREVNAEFHFGADGMPERVTAMRYRDLGNGRAALTSFVGTFRDFRVVDGLRVPFLVEGSWIIDGAPFTFAHFAVQRLEYSGEPF